MKKITIYLMLVVLFGLTSNVNAAVNIHICGSFNTTTNEMSDCTRTSYDVKEKFWAIIVPDTLTGAGEINIINSPGPTRDPMIFNTAGLTWYQPPFYTSFDLNIPGQHTVTFEIKNEAGEITFKGERTVTITGKNYNLTGLYASGKMEIGMPTDIRYQYTDLESFFIGFNFDYLYGKGRFHFDHTSPTGEKFRRSANYDTGDEIWKNPPYNQFLSPLSKGIHTFDFFIEENGLSAVKAGSFTVDIKDKLDPMPEPEKNMALTPIYLLLLN